MSALWEQDRAKSAKSAISLFTTAEPVGLSSTATTIPPFTRSIWGGGALKITEQIGNNGIGDAIDAELDSLAGMGSTSPSSVLASISIPFSAGPSSAYTLYNGNLAAGYYAIDTYLAVGNVTDPNYQINIASSVPEPSPMFALLAAFLALPVWLKLRAAGSDSGRSDVSGAR